MNRESRQRLRMAQVHGWIFVLMLLGIIIVAYGLDWQAALYGGFDQPPPDPSDLVITWETVP